MNKIKLSCEGTIIEVDQEIVGKSIILKNMVDNSDKNEEIPLPNIKLQTLRKVIEYCEHYKNTEPLEIKKPLPSANLEDYVEEWDFKYIDIEKVEDLINLVVAANFLDIEGLINLSCAKIACHIRGKSVEEIRELFGIENDFTPEEEA